MMKMKVNKKIAGASAMLMLSATMLGTSTFAWFTMNKEVHVTGMQLKAHSEEGLLINEVKASRSETWDDTAQAVASPTAYALRPASTLDLAQWWHANSKKSSIDAGVDNLAQTVDVGSGKYYDLTAKATDKTIIDAEDAAGEVQKATGNTQAETHVFYTNATYDNSNDYVNGEGYYVRYTYYLKSSGETDLVLSNLQARVKAEKQNADGATDSTNLDKALRVGVAVPASNSSSAAIAGYGIYAPVTGGQTSYGVTRDANGSESETVSATGATTGSFSAYATLNKTAQGASAPNTITIPNVTSNGIPVYVYVWFEGEDQNCKSDNLTEVLDSYEISVDFNVGDWT